MSADRTGFEQALREARLLITAGSGGVGKTTTAAAIGLRAAQAGRRVAVLTIDPARRLADALGLSELTGEMRQVDPAHFEAAGFACAGEMWAMMLDIKTTGDQMVRRFAPDPATAARILDNTYYQYFSTSLAGAQEYMAVEQVRALTADERFDLVVLDTPPAAHALDFLDAPDRLLAALDSRAMQVLRGGTEPDDGLAARLLGRGKGLVLKSLNKLTGGPFIEELTDFLLLFGSILDALKVSSRAVQALLRAETTRFFLVSAPYRANVDEALHFKEQLDRRGFPLGGFIINRVHHPCPSIRDDVETLAHALDELADVPLERREALVTRMLEALKAHQRMAERDREAVDRLARLSHGPPVLVPLLPQDVRDLRGLDRVARSLTA
jgi:anion-transporting  ArsA/GET3 family ATPase